MTDTVIAFLSANEDFLTTVAVAVFFLGKVIVEIITGTYYSFGSYYRRRDRPFLFWLGILTGLALSILLTGWAAYYSCHSFTSLSASSYCSKINQFGSDPWKAGFAILMGIGCMFLMKVVSEIITGTYYSFGEDDDEYDRRRNPFLFWLGVVTETAVIALCFTGLVVFYFCHFSPSPSVWSYCLKMNRFLPSIYQIEPAPLRKNR